MANRARKPLAASSDADSRIPRYLQVASVLRRRIRDGRWAVGDKIATLEELEREFGVARVTVRQAIDLLQGEGLVQVVPGPRHLRHQGARQRPLDPARHRLGQPDRADPRQRRASALDRRGRPAPDRGGRRDAGAGLRLPAQRPDAGRHASMPTRACTSPSTSTPARPSSSPRARRWPCSPRWTTSTSRAPTRRSPSAPPTWRRRSNLGIALNAPTAEARCVVADASGTVIYVGEITYPGDCVRLNIELIGEGRG